jgi:DNA (cytosine-5)-methyltransferase 1
MKYGSVCSGIEAASVAWHPLGWDPQWFSEIESFPSEVLKQRFPDVPNLGDMTQLTSNPTFNEKSIDLLVGGTPCQSFSVAGLRGGLADPRGNLMLTFLGLADAKKPKWIVWENVPGVLSSNGGKDFGTFLGALAELGYGFAYRVLDAQHFGVAQRRRRVFVVGYLGDWRLAAAVLFESESLQRDSKQSRAKRQETPTDAQGGSRTTSPDGRETIGTLRQRDYKGIGNDDLESGRGLAIEIKDVAQPIPINTMTVMGRPSDDLNPRMGIGIGNPNDPCPTLTKAHHHAVAQPQYFENHPNDSRVTGPHDVGNTVSARYGTGGGNTPIVSQPIAFQSVDYGGDATTNLSPTLRRHDPMAVAQPIAVDCFNQTINEKTSQTIGSSASDINHIGGVLQTMAIRRLTPRECERLQGFPDDWTKIHYHKNGKSKECPDGPRYKACGNSMAVPVMRWIGERIQMIEQLMEEIK